ncbi:carotenoid oxygenase family protein [Streptomyces sp. NBC_01264]|uniref:carotenoid oxygenase family protein n=1 Tax=Streptomyces sp. NBC_01264 TaxID=2903804 RepID=UPI00224F270F|nr:carotenoid oxygenase family protein [Streptomyces sp. NBC_01264]MCX4775602.1 carotenoid oxygenase family protein [Streptomyces sp. NBC_01264]
MNTHTPPRFDPTRVPHLLGAFAPVSEEVDVADLEVTGEIPSALDGLYLRNGPNPRFTPIGSYLYPIDGDGMLHGVWLSQGRARYRNRFVRTHALLAEERAGRALWGGLESMIMPDADQVGPELAGTFRDMPDINVVRHGGRLLALAESACPYRIGAGLETLGREDFGGALPVGITAHPKIDPVTGEMVVFCYGLEAPYLTWSVIGRDGAVTRGPTPVGGVDEPMMIHDMALTERYAVIVLAPAFFDLPAAMAGGSFLAWRPERGTRVVLVPRDGGPPRWAADEAFWLWHTVNAYDDGPGPDAPVVLDYVQWSRLTVGSEPEPGATPASGGLVRARIDPVAGTMVRTLLDDARVEFPRIDDRRIGRRHRYAALATETGRTDLLPGEYDAVRFHDTETGTARVWDAGDLSVGEPVFAPVPGRDSEEEGYWLTFATDRTDGSAWFLVVPAQDPASGPVARAPIPVRVPLGLHGCWLPTAGG